MKFLLVQFAVYAAAAFAVGVAAGVLWQRRPVRAATNRMRRLERAKRSVEERLAQAELDLQRTSVELAASQDLRRVVAGLRLELVEVSAAHQAAVAAKDSTALAVIQLRADLDRRVVPTYSSSSVGDAERRHSADVAALRAERDLDAIRRTAERNELAAQHSVETAALLERLGSTERELQALQRRHHEYLRTTQTSLTAAVVRAERAEALLSLRQSVVGDVTVASVIDLRLPRSAVPDPEPAA